MRRAILLIWIFLLCSAGMRAQGTAGAGGGTRTVYSPTQHHEFDPWQIGINYQYNRDNLFGSPFNTNGVNVTLARYFGRWFGVEAEAGGGFGNTRQTTNPPNVSAKSLFVGAGPRLAYRNHGRIEPWIHLVVGWEYYRFDQTGGLLGTDNALAGFAGGGVNVYLTHHVALHAGADAVGSRFFSTNQRSFQVIGGPVLNF